MVQPGEEAVDDRGVEVVAGDVVAQGLGPRAVAVVVDLGARDADDPEVVGELAVTVAQVERREQLAQGEVAGAAEDGEVAGVDGGDRVHGAPPYGRFRLDATQLTTFQDIFVDATIGAP